MRDAPQYVLCAIHSAFDRSAEFRDWPLHTTLIPWFTVDNEQQFASAVEEMLQNSLPFTVTVGGIKVWGSHVVNLLRPADSDLHDLHAALLYAVETSGEVTVRQRYTGGNYTPHVTHQRGMSLDIGQSIDISTIYLVKKSQNGQNKIVCRSWLLTD